MIESKLLKVKKWVDLNEAALRLSIALNEPINALDLLELSLDDELVLSVKLPFDKKYVARKIKKKHTPIGVRLRESFRFNKVFNDSRDATDKDEREFILQEYQKYLSLDSVRELPEDKKTFDFYCENTMVVEWEYGKLNYLSDNVYELSMLGAEMIDVMWLIQQNREKEMDELTNLDGVILRGKDGEYYNLQEKFNEEFINKIKKDPVESDSMNLFMNFEINDRHYFPAGGLPEGCEIGMSPSNLSKFESELNDEDSSFSEGKILSVMGAVLREVTSSDARRWTQGDLSTRIADKKILGLSERVINGVFASAIKHYKTKT